MSKDYRKSSHQKTLIRLNSLVYRIFRIQPKNRRVEVFRTEDLRSRIPRTDGY